MKWKCDGQRDCSSGTDKTNCRRKKQSNEEFGRELSAYSNEQVVFLYTKVIIVEVIGSSHIKPTAAP